MWFINVAYHIYVWFLFTSVVDDKFGTNKTFNRHFSNKNKNGMTETSKTL